MITIKMTSPTYRGAAVLKERNLGPFTGFTLSTMINKKTALNTSLGNVYCSSKITIA